MITLEIDEFNGAGATVTHNIANGNMGGVDSAGLDPVASPITAGQRSFAKYQKLHVTAMGGSSKLDNIKIWRTGALGGSATHLTNARLTSYVNVSYATPTQSAVTDVNQTMPTSTPASANLGIAGSLTGSLTAVGSSDYLVHQIVTDSGDTAGSTTTLNFQYDETA
jgi:hypothetical protein